MRTFKKIVAVLVMVLSILTIVGLIVGIIGSWFVNAQLRVAGTNLLLTGETTIATVQTTLGTADGLLTTSIDGLNEIETRAMQIGSIVTDNNIIVDGVMRRLDFDIVPALGRAVETYNAIEANLIAINEAVIAINAIPMLRFDMMDMPGISQLSETLDMLEQLRADVLDFVAQVRQQRQDIVDGAQRFVITPARSLNERLRDISARMTEADLRLATLSAQLAGLRERLPAILNLITVVLNLLFALSVLAFASLFAHALQVYRCPDDGLSRVLSQPCATQTVSATVIKPTA